MKDHQFKIGDRIYCPMINKYFTVTKTDHNLITKEPCYTGVTDSGEDVLRVIESNVQRSK